MSKNLLPHIVSASRNCGFSQQVNDIIKEKFTDYEQEVFLKWLQIVEQEKQIKVNQSKRKFF